MLPHPSSVVNLFLALFSQAKAVLLRSEVIFHNFWRFIYSATPMLLNAVYVLFIVHSSIKSIVAKCPAHPEWPVCPYPSLLSFSIAHYKCYTVLSAPKPAFLHSISPCHALIRQEICCFCTNKSLSANGRNRHRLRSFLLYCHERRATHA